MKTSQTNTRKYSPLGKKIMRQLINRGMTAKQLADELGTTPQYLNSILHGERSGKKYLSKIKSILDIVA